MIFDSDVSKEYLRLYQAGTLSAQQLDEIRLEGLKKLKAKAFEAMQENVA